jgi:hypothetical protein
MLWLPPVPSPAPHHLGMSRAAPFLPGPVRNFAEYAGPPMRLSQVDSSQLPAPVQRGKLASAKLNFTTDKDYTWHVR